MTRTTSPSLSVLFAFIGLLFAFFAGMVARAGDARAQAAASPAPPVYVLALRTDDADDQADGLTQALRARVRETAGWSLTETGQSFDTLAIALRCPPKPDASCLQRIGEQLRAARYVWGSVARGRHDEVIAEVHMWTRDKPEVSASATYPDTARDAGDPRLRTVAKALFEKLTTVRSEGTLVVHAGVGTGTVVVDDRELGVLKEGVARFSVPAGTHVVAARVTGFDAPAQTTKVEAGAERDLVFALAPVHSDTSPPPVSRAPMWHAKTVAGYVAIAVGAGLLVAGGVEALNFQSDKNSADQDRPNIPSSVVDSCATPVNAAAQDACQKSKDGTTAATLGWVFTGAGALAAGVGLWLVLTDHPTREWSAGSGHGQHGSMKPAGKWVLIPKLGPREQSLDVRFAF